VMKYKEEEDRFEIKAEDIPNQHDPVKAS